MRLFPVEDFLFVCFYFSLHHCIFSGLLNLYFFFGEYLFCMYINIYTVYIFCKCNLKSELWLLKCLQGLLSPQPIISPVIAWLCFQHNLVDFVFQPLLLLTSWECYSFFFYWVYYTHTIFNASLSISHLLRFF